MSTPVLDPASASTLRQRSCAGVLRCALLGNLQDAAEAIGRCVAGHDRDTVLALPALREEIMTSLEVMRESVMALPEADKADMPDVPWAAWEGLRLVVGGSAREWRDQVWTVIHELVPTTLHGVTRHLGLLKDAGLRGVQMGIEAGSDREQKEVYDRTSTVAQILAFDEMNLELGLDVKYDVIIDNPLAYTSDKDALFQLLMDLKSPYKIYLYSLTLYPKSSVTEKMLTAGYATESDVEGFATKSFRQFRVSVDWQRSNEDKFYLALYMLVNKQFISRDFIWKIYKSDFWRKHPDLLLEFAQGANLVRMTGIAAEMAFRGELSLQKVREYGNIRKMINQ